MSRWSRINLLSIVAPRRCREVSHRVGVASKYRETRPVRVRRRPESRPARPVKEPRGANGETATGPGGWIQIGILGRIKSEFAIWLGAQQRRASVVRDDVIVSLVGVALAIFFRVQQAIDIVEQSSLVIVSPGQALMKCASPSSIMASRCVNVGASPTWSANGPSSFSFC
jgi:hypothetical protein